MDSTEYLVTSLNKSQNKKTENEKSTYQKPGV